MNGIILLNKEPGKTSFEVVNRVKRLLGAKKAGHAGTLDKFASGLLIICLDRATSFQNIFMHGEKVYRAIIKLGEQTNTLDPYGKIIKRSSVKELTGDEIQKVLDEFTGEIEQYPPLFSAIWVNGKRSYKRALNGEEVKVSPRKVYIHWIKLLDFQNDEIVIETKVSKGTYIRSLARDIAERLGMVGYCKALKRLSIGRFSIEMAIKIDEVSENRIIPIENALSFLTSIEVNESLARKIDNGLSPGVIFSDKINIKDRYIRVLYNKRLIAVLENNKRVKYFKVLGLN